MLGYRVWFIALRQPGRRCIVGDVEGAVEERQNRAALRSGPNLPDDRGRTAGAEEELADSGVIVLVTATHQQRHVLDHQEHGARFAEGLWRWAAHASPAGSARRGRAAGRRKTD